MPHQRTSGMTVVGILNIVFGSFGGLVSLLAIVGGGLIAAAGSSMASDGSAEGQQLGSAAAAGGGIIAIVGLVMLAACGALAAAGFGVLKLKPWGRTLSMVCGGVIALLQILSILNGSFGIMTIGMLGYGVLLIVMFLQPNWKAAFCPTSSLADTIDINKDNYRKAA